MQQVKFALSQTTSHGLPRVVSNKPVYVRVAWLLLFLLMSGLFLKDFVTFVDKLKSQKVTTSIESEGEKFQFPDVYACFEHPMSGSYSGSIQNSTAAAINDSFSNWERQFRNYLKKFNISQQVADERVINHSLRFVHSLPYQLIFDALAHRIEQTIISSIIAYTEETGEQNIAVIEPKEFNHPLHLRCLQWKINSTWQDRLKTTESWSGLSITLLLDTNSSFLKSEQHAFFPRASVRGGTAVPVSDWLFSIQGYTEADRVAGLKIFLSPPGEYPSDFVSSFSLGPGKRHSVKVEMTRNVLTQGQFKCMGSSHPEVEFANPYDLSAYNHAYSYSYCYYFAYHQKAQNIFNMSGHINPLPWLLRGRPFLFNLTETPNYFHIEKDEYFFQRVKKFIENVRSACEEGHRCSSLDYSASISSADWPTQSSLVPFINSSVRQAWTRAKARNLSVPALDFLMTGNASSVASYVRSNLLKVHLKPGCVMCNRITFSIDYGFANFVSEVGGIMGIYLGMSLLTLCELLELLFDLVVWCSGKNGREDLESAVSSSCSVSPELRVHST